MNIHQVIPGDIDDSGIVELRDAILVLQALTNSSINSDIFTPANLNDDKRIGLEEAIYVLQKIAEIR